MKSKKGLASMSIEKRRAIASQGGKSAHAQGRAHTWNKQEASAAGKIGGQNGRNKKKTKQAEN